MEVLDGAEWRVVDGPAQSRSRHGCCSFGGKLWVAGGRGAHGVELGSVEQYDCDTQQWIEGPEMQKLTGDTQLFVLGDVMVAVGIVAGDADAKEIVVEQLDAKDAEWKVLDASNAHGVTRSTFAVHWR
jgi:hypothetical protein